jgi:hypothetical protein
MDSIPIEYLFTYQAIYSTLTISHYWSQSIFSMGTICSGLDVEIMSNSNSTLNVHQKMRWLLKSPFDQSHVQW